MQANSHENIQQFYNRAQHIVFEYFFLSNQISISVRIYCSLIVLSGSKFVYSCCFTIHDNFVCEFFAHKNSAELCFFFRSPTSSDLCFLWSETYFTVFNVNIYDIILLLYIFHSSTLFPHYLLLFLHHYVHTFLLLISTIKFQDFLFLLSSQYILLPHYLLKQIGHD